MNNLNLLIAVPVITASLFHSAALFAQQPVMNDWMPVSDKSLASLRAGFVLDNGLIVDIQVNKQLLINGEQVSGFTYTTTDTLAEDVAAIMGNQLNPIVQNQLNDQILSSITNIDISISNASVAQQTLSQAIMHETYFNLGGGY